MASVILGAHVSFLASILLPGHVLGDEQAFDYGLAVGVVICICAGVCALLLWGVWS